MSNITLMQEAVKLNEKWLNRKLTTIEKIVGYASMMFATTAEIERLNQRLKFAVPHDSILKIPLIKY